MTLTACITSSHSQTRHQVIAFMSRLIAAQLDVCAKQVAPI